MCERGGASVTKRRSCDPLLCSPPSPPQESSFAGSLVCLRALEVHLVDISRSSSTRSMWPIRGGGGRFRAERRIWGRNIRWAFRGLKGEVLGGQDGCRGGVSLHGAGARIHQPGADVGWRESEPLPCHVGFSLLRGNESFPPGFPVPFQLFRWYFSYFFKYHPAFSPTVPCVVRDALTGASLGRKTLTPVFPFPSPPASLSAGIYGGAEEQL